jgi:IclR family transcriptional regulator, pca regulon regulatory protein
LIRISGTDEDTHARAACRPQLDEEGPMAGGSATTRGTIEQSEPTGLSQSLERGLAILSCFSERRPLLGISDLARAVDLNKSTAHRYVATLTALGYLQQDAATRKYRLGLRVIDLGFAAVNSMEISKVAGPFLQALSEETGYSANMAVLDGVDIVYVARYRTAREGRLGVDLNLHVGSRLPAYCTSMGKVLLAHQPAERQARLIERVDLTRRGPNTLTTREALVSALAQVRRVGTAVNDEELAAGLRSIAVPVRDGFGEVVAAVNLAVHLSIWGASTEAIARRYEGALRRAAEGISRRLGYLPRPDD